MKKKNEKKIQQKNNLPCVGVDSIVLETLSNWSLVDFEAKCARVTFALFHTETNRDRKRECIFFKKKM